MQLTSSFVATLNSILTINYASWFVCKFNVCNTIIIPILQTLVA